jgi:hypothetical protein
MVLFKFQDRVHSPHIYMQGAGAGGLAAHAETSATDAKGAGCAADRDSYFFASRGNDYCPDGYRIKTGYIIDDLLGSTHIHWDSAHLTI